MNQTPQETSKQYLLRLAKCARQMTQEQVDACAWVMGGGNWTPENVANMLEIEANIPTERII